MIYFEQKAGNFGQAMAVPALPLPTALIYARSIRMLDKRLREYQIFTVIRMLLWMMYVKLDNTDTCHFTGLALPQPQHFRIFLIRKGFWNTSWMDFHETTRLWFLKTFTLGSCWRHFTECLFRFELVTS